MGNSDLNRAKEAKEDEFYTQLSDIEKELRYYRQHFKDKTVFCNCDDPFESNFFKYFVLNFNRLGLKKLIVTCFCPSPIAHNQLTLTQFTEDADESQSEPNHKPAYKAIVTTVYDKTEDGEIGLDDVKALFESGENELTELKGDGDFRSKECMELLDEADIVVTNPPFSLFREYISTLVSHNKKFIIIGPQNAIKYRDVFPYLMNNQIWLGNNSGDMSFCVPDYYEPKQTRYWVDENGQKWRSMGNMCWFTNLDIKKRHEELILVRRFNPADYPHYENFDGIDVSSVDQIPCDYPGVMGVPITFMETHNPDQFELLGTSTGNLAKQMGITKNHRGRTDVYYLDSDGKPKCPYQRLFIRNRHPEQPRGSE